MAKRKNIIDELAELRHHIKHLKGDEKTLAGRAVLISGFLFQRDTGSTMYEICTARDSFLVWNIGQPSTTFI